MPPITAPAINPPARAPPQPQPPPRHAWADDGVKAVKPIVAAVANANTDFFISVASSCKTQNPPKRQGFPANNRCKRTAVKFNVDERPLFPPIDFSVANSTEKPARMAGATMGKSSRDRPKRPKILMFSGWFGGNNGGLTSGVISDHA